MNRSILLLCCFAMAGLAACTERAPETESQATGTTENGSEILVAPITEADSINVGLKVGEQVPLTISLLGKNGETSLEKILESGPALVVFSRSVEWCPYCQTQLKSINAIVGDLGERGYRLYCLTYDDPGQQDRFSKNQMLEYQLLSDQRSGVIDGFGLRDPQYTEGRAVGVPYASVFVIDMSGKIIAKSVSGDYKKRPTNEQILALVDSI